MMNDGKSMKSLLNIGNPLTEIAKSIERQISPFEQLQSSLMEGLLPIDSFSEIAKSIERQMTPFEQLQSGLVEELLPTAIDPLDPFSEVIESVERQASLLEQLQPSLAEELLVDFDTVQLELPEFKIPEPTLNPNLASEFCKGLERRIAEFNQSLNHEYEVGFRLVNFSQAITFHLESIGYCNPSLIFLSGFTDEGDPVEFVQHISQISILLIKVRRKNPSEPRRPIGFAVWPEDEEDI